MSVKKIASKIEEYIEKDKLFFDKESLDDDEKTELFSISFEDFAIKISVQENGEFIQFFSSGYDFEDKIKNIDLHSLNELSFSLMKRNSLKKLCKWIVTKYGVFLNVDFPLEDSDLTYRQYERMFSIVFLESDEIIPKLSRLLEQKNPNLSF